MVRKLFLGMGIGTGIVVLFIVVLLVGLLSLKLMWAWVVKDIFPGAVEQGLIADTISWWASFKVAIVLAILSIFWGRSGGHD